MRRGRRQFVDAPTPGASKVIVWMPDPPSARSNGSHISMLPPMPMMSSSGRPSPRTATRMRIPSTSTKRMRWSRRGAEESAPPRLLLDALTQLRLRDFRRRTLAGSSIG